MLSGETTIGKYPLECVGALDLISRRIEEEVANESAEPAVFLDERMKLRRSAVVMANELPNSFIVTFTRRGINATGVAAHRPARAPILAITDSLETLRQLRMVRAIEPYFIDELGDPEKTIGRATAMLRDLGRIQPGDKLVIISDVLTEGNRRIESIQLRTVE
jgi:pyruvate kinase